MYKANNQKLKNNNMTSKIKESDLAKGLIKSLSDLPHEIYQEVETPNGTADIVLKDRQILWAVEVKLGMSLTVLAQARYNLRNFNYSSICLPSKCTGGKTFNFGRELCVNLGIGIFLVYGHSSRELLKAKFQRKAVTKRIMLNERQKTFAEAGNSDGKRWTSFNETVSQLERYVRKNPGCRLKDALTDITHHYASLSSAQNSVRQWIRTGVIETIIIDRGKLNLRN